MYNQVTSNYIHLQSRILRENIDVWFVWTDTDDRHNLGNVPLADLFCLQVCRSMSVFP